MMKEKEWLYAGAVILLLILLFFAFGKPLSVASLTCPVNLPCSGTVTLSGIPAPDTDYSDGKVSKIFCAAFVVDSAGNYKYQGQQKEITSGTTFTDTVTFTPTTAGTYAYGAACVQTNNTYNYQTQTWGSWTTPVIVASDKGTITVTGPSAPPEPSVNVFDAIVNWVKSILCQYFGLFC
jgi:hypothetical protein